MLDPTGLKVEYDINSRIQHVSVGFDTDPIIIFFLRIYYIQINKK